MQRPAWIISTDRCHRWPTRDDPGGDHEQCLAVVGGGATSGVRRVWASYVGHRGEIFKTRACRCPPGFVPCGGSPVRRQGAAPRVCNRCWASAVRDGLDLVAQAASGDGTKGTRPADRLGRSRRDISRGHPGGGARPTKREGSVDCPWPSKRSARGMGRIRMRQIRRCRLGPSSAAAGSGCTHPPRNWEKLATLLR